MLLAGTLTPVSPNIKTPLKNYSTKDNKHHAIESRVDFLAEIIKRLLCFAPITLECLLGVFHLRFWNGNVLMNSQHSGTNQQ